MAEEDEVLMEVEALEAVYGNDCVVLESFPPHLRVHIKPRTADVSSQQFVEAVIEVQAGPQYPDKPPNIYLIESKGLDEQRQKHLITTLCDKACELSSCLMLVSLCEEAIEKLTVMNHPDGDCPMCLSPLVSEDEQNETLPFMKLMSCFHCFHSECILQWWNWLQKERESKGSSSSTTTMRLPVNVENGSDTLGVKEESMGNCPVCRKVFHCEDFRHVLDLVGTHHSQSIADGMEFVHDDDKLLHSDAQNLRRQKFEAILKLQQENNGLIEPKKDLLVLPGMFLPRPAVSPEEATEVHPTVPLETSLGTSSIRPHSAVSPEEATEVHPTVPLETSLGTSSIRPHSVELRNSGRRKQRVQDSRKQGRQWIRKEHTAK